MKDAGAFSCWMALDDVDTRNGCMHFVRGSHSVGRLSPISLTDPQDVFELIPEEKRGVIDPEPYAAEMGAGSCTFHDGLTFHYAPPNRTDSPRRAFVVIFMPDGTVYNGGGHVCTDGLGLGVGDAITGDAFPVLP